MFNFDIQTILIIAAVVAAAYYGSQYLVGVDTRVEGRRRAANELAGQLQALGLVQIPDLLLDYGVGDYSGMGEHLIRVVKLFSGNPAAVLTEFNQIFGRLLDAKLSTKEGRALIEAKLAETAASAEK